MAFFEPLAFAFTALYGVLVLFYLWERWRRRVTVPSLLLWETVREDVLRARRVRPDLLFVLQLLLLTCLIVGLARPYFRDGVAGRANGRHVLVLDTSASMQAREGRDTRFDAARSQALERLRSLDADAEVMLVSAGHTAQVVLNFTRDHAAVAAALNQIAPTDTGGDLALALAFVDSLQQRNDVVTDVDVFTDVPRSQLPAPLRDAVTVFQVGETDDNLGIEALQVFQGRFQDYRGARAYVLVQNFAHREQHGFLTVRLEDRPVTRIGFSIAARDSKGFLIHDFPGPGRVVAELEVADALAADNVAYGWIRPVSPVRAVVVSPASPLVDDLRELAAATPSLRLTTVSPEEFSPEQLHDADVVILHRFVPEPPPLVPALYIYPPSENHRFPVAGNAENVEVLDWNARHEVLRSLRPLAALPLQRTRILSAPAWSQVLLWSRTLDREFPLAFAGESDGRREACIAFDLEAERLLGSDNINSFLFFMNLLAWLSPAADDAHVLRTGDVQALGPFPAEPVRVQDPRGGVETLPAGQATLQPSLAGEYRVSAGAKTCTLLANFFDPQESDIGRASKEPPSPPAARRAPPLHATRTTGPPPADWRAWLYGAAAALFVLEWLARRRVE